MYNSYPSSVSSSSSIASFIVLWLVIFAIAGVLSLIPYALESFGLYNIAKKMGVQKPWMAFVPFARKYLEGTIAGEISAFGKTVTKTGLWNVAYPIGAGIIYFILSFIVGIITGILASVVGILGSLFSLVGLVLYIIPISVVVFSALVRMKICSKYMDHSDSLLHAILSAVIPVYAAILMFILGRKEPLEPIVTDISGVILDDDEGDS